MVELCNYNKWTTSYPIYSSICKKKIQKKNYVPNGWKQHKTSHRKTTQNTTSSYLVNIAKFIMMHGGNMVIWVMLHMQSTFKQLSWSCKTPHNMYTSKKVLKFYMVKLNFLSYPKQQFHSIWSNGWNMIFSKRWCTLSIIAALLWLSPTFSLLHDMGWSSRYEIWFCII